MRTYGKANPTQEQMFYASHRRSADANDTFLEIVSDGLTADELQRHIAKRPEVWARFENWLPKLPKGE